MTDLQSFVSVKLDLEDILKPETNEVILKQVKVSHNIENTNLTEEEIVSIALSIETMGFGITLLNNKTQNLACLSLIHFEKFKNEEIIDRVV